MIQFTLTTEEIVQTRKTIAEIAARFDSPEAPGLLRESTLLAHQLPRRLCRALNEFRLTEPDDALFIVKGYPIDEVKIGPTPEHWQRSAATRPPTMEEEILFILTCSLVGDCIGWKTQQGGRIVHDVMPVRGMEQEQIGTGSEQLIWWHTEDAFHPLHGDYLAMMCLRNPDRVATTFASIEALGLDADHWRTLFEPHFSVQPDCSHRPEYGVGGAGDGGAEAGVGGADEALYERVARQRQAPEKIAVLSGDRRSPYIRIDPYFMEPLDDNPKAARAFTALTEALDRRLTDVVLEPGDICLIDNCKAVHGRRPFKARYDGHDRWFKRINITRDLRKSRQARDAAESRIIL
jgi:Fe(II)/alpha-ketoglutarate-dependent arginine beta-hydroxylase